jgi:hypothetical protein
MKKKTIIRWMLVILVVVSMATPVFAENFSVRTLKVLVLTDGLVPVSRIYQEIRNTNRIIEGQVYTKLEIVDIVKRKWRKKKGQQIMKQLRRKADRLASEYDFDIAIAYIRLKNGRKFMGKNAGRYILVRATAKGCGIVTAHEVGHSFVGHQHDTMGLMSAKALKKKDITLMFNTQLRWKNNRWRTFN